MSDMVRVGGFAVSLAVVFGAAWGVGSAVRPALAPVAPLAAPTPAPPPAPAGPPAALSPVAPAPGGDLGAPVTTVAPLTGDIDGAPAFTPVRVVQVDGYQVRLDGDLVPRRSSQVFATVSRGGRAVTDLEPFRGAFGDLTVLRGDDLAAAPVDPGEGPAPSRYDRSGPAIAFTARVPTPGGYRVILSFRHLGAVHVAQFAIVTREGS